MAIISGKQGNKGLKIKGPVERRQFWGYRNIENQDFDFGEQDKRFISGNTPTGKASNM